MLVFSGLETEDFTCRSPGELEVVRNDILKPLARDGLPLYPYAHDDGSTGKLRNLASLTDATLTGGSTLSGAAKRRNDFQHAGSLVPGNCLFRAAPAWSNLLYSLNADAPSFEGGTTGGWAGSNASGLVATTLWSWHGQYSLKIPITNSSSYCGAKSVLTSITNGGSTYTAAGVLYGVVGRTYRIMLYDNVSGTTGTEKTLTSPAEFFSVTKTFDAASTTRELYFQIKNGVAGQDVFYIDAVILVSGSTVPMFTEAENTACHATFPTPFSAGEPFSFVTFVWTPWAGNDSSEHIFWLDNTSSNYVMLAKTNFNALYFRTYDSTGGGAHTASISLNAANWPAGSFHAIAGSVDAANNKVLALDGVLATSFSGTGTRESAVSTMVIGCWPGIGSYANGLILGPFIYRGVAWDSATCQRMSRLKAPPPRDLVVRAA